MFDNIPNGENNTRLLVALYTQRSDGVGCCVTVSTPPPERFRQLIASKLITLSKVDKTNIILIANN